MARAPCFRSMSEFRRLRQSTCSLLRSLPDSAWLRVGTSRRVHDWQIRSLAETLVAHDEDVLTQMDLALDRTACGTASPRMARAHLYEMLKIVPVTLRDRT